MRDSSKMRSLSAFVLLAVAAIVAAGCTPSVGELNAVLRGDRAFARGEVEEALAEYRLAILQGNEEPEVYARVAHTYARMGRVDETADNYARATALDSVWADQAVSDLVRLGRDAAERDDLFSVASAIQSALQFRPGLSVGDLALPLARHYFRNGEFGRSLPFFQRALASVPADSAPRIMFETAMAYQEIGDCGRAVVFFEQYREVLPSWQRTEVDWQLGNCSYRYAQTLQQEGRWESALRHLDTTIEIGEPRSVLGTAYFEKGRILSLLGDCQEALGAYREVTRADVAGTGSLVNRAERRIDEIRFGGYEDTFDPEGRCGLPEPEVDRPMPDGLPSDSFPGGPEGQEAPVEPDELRESRGELPESGEERLRTSRAPDAPAADRPR